MSILKDPMLASGILSHLEEQAIRGYEWVVYDTDNPINNKYDLLCFKGRFEAEDEAKAYQQIFNWHEAVPIRNLIYQLKELEKNQSGLLSETELNQPNSTLEINNDNMDDKVNRAKQLWENWEEKANTIQELTGTMDDKQTLNYKYQFLSDGLNRLSVNPSENEKLYVHAIKVVTDKLREQLYPNPILRLFHRIYKAVIDNPAHLFFFKEAKKDNLVVLESQLKSFGLQHFAGKLDRELDFEREKIDLKSLSNINGNDRLEVNVHLEKDGESGYRLNGYTATITDQNGETKSTTLKPENNIKLTECINLLQGRPIYKNQVHPDNSVTKAWIQMEQGTQTQGGKLEVLSFSPNYEFDLKKVLTDQSIQSELYGISMDAIRRGIEAGNNVAINVNGKAKIYLSANPSEKSINFFDAEKKPISLDQLKKLVKPINQKQRKDLKLIKQKNIEPENQLQVNR